TIHTRRSRTGRRRSSLGGLPCAAGGLLLRVGWGERVDAGVGALQVAAEFGYLLLQGGQPVRVGPGRRGRARGGGAFELLACEASDACVEDAHDSTPFGDTWPRARRLRTARTTAFVAPTVSADTFRP